MCFIFSRVLSFPPHHKAHYTVMLFVFFFLLFCLPFSLPFTAALRWHFFSNTVVKVFAFCLLSCCYLLCVCVFAFGSCCRPRFCPGLHERGLGFSFVYVCTTFSKLVPLVIQNPGVGLDFPVCMTIIACPV